MDRKRAATMPSGWTFTPSYSAMLLNPRQLRGLLKTQPECMTSSYSDSRANVWSSRLVPLRRFADFEAGYAFRKWRRLSVHKANFGREIPDQKKRRARPARPA